MIQASIADWVRAELRSDFEAARLAGDASTNCFYRLSVPAGTAILMICSEPDRFGSHLHMSHYFARMGLPVAQIIAASERRSAMLLEDLGDRHLCDAGVVERPGLYRLAVDCLVRLQRDAGPFRDSVDTGLGTYRPPILAANRLLWELEFFATHYVAALTNRDATPVRAEFSRLLALQQTNPLVLCHRDYHSRNIMLRGPGIALVDLQDARWGHRLYDLASLLADSYVDLDSGLVEECKRRFFDATREQWATTQEFELQFDCVCVQRNLKAIGTFAAQALLRGKKDYLGYVPRTKRLLERRLARVELMFIRRGLDSIGFFEETADRMPESAPAGGEAAE